MVAPSAQVSAVVILAVTNTADGSVMSLVIVVLQVISFALRICIVCVPTPKTGAVVTGEIVEPIHVVPPSTEYSNPATVSKFST